MDKNIIFVGPSDYLKGSGYGDEINNFDIVVRTNDGFVIPPDYWDDYGSRCDVLYLNNAWIRRNILKNKIKEHRRGIIQKIIHTTKIKLIVVKRESSKKILETVFSKIAPKYKQQLNIVTTSNLWREDRAIWTKGFKDRISHYEPTLLPYIISDLNIIGNNVKQIFITGCDFYKSNQHWASFYNRGVNQKKEMLARQKSHNTEADKAYLVKKMKTNDKICVDSVMHKMLNP